MAATFDNSLIPAFHRNEPSAIRVLFREYYTSMVLYANQLINDRQEAAEMVVNTFLKLIAMRQNFRTAEDVKTFLLVTIRNSCYDYLRCTDLEKPSKKEMLSLADLVQTDKEGSPVPFTIEMLFALYEGVNRLAAQCGEVFKLFFYNKMTTKDIAVQLNMPVKTVRAYKTKAVKVLRPLLAKKLTITPSLN